MIMKTNPIGHLVKTNPISKMPKMNANLYVIEDYENETTFRHKKTNPNKPNFKCPQTHQRSGKKRVSETFSGSHLPERI